MIKGAYAAAVTPLKDGGQALDEKVIPSLVDFLVDGGLDGMFVIGTTGEGILLSVEERKRATELFISSNRARIGVSVHCGAQTTADTVALAAHAARAGANAVAVIGPPYFSLDESALLYHFLAAARACSPLPFYLYEFADRSGYAIPLTVVERLRDQASNLAGMKVSNSPFERFEPYLSTGVDVLVGPESLIRIGMERGAVGAVSALATAWPELVVAAVKDPASNAAAKVGALREALAPFPLNAALKFVLAKRGVPIRPDVRPPLRQLTEEESSRVTQVGEVFQVSLSY